jgi:hypothetical protein
VQIIEKAHVASVPAKPGPKGREVFRYDPQRLIIKMQSDAVLKSVLNSVEQPSVMFPVQLRNRCDHSSVLQEIGNGTSHIPTTWLDDSIAVFDRVIGEISDALEQGADFHRSSFRCLKQMRGTGTARHGSVGLHKPATEFCGSRSSRLRSSLRALAAHSGDLPIHRFESFILG